MSTRYKHLYNRTGEQLKNEDISRSIRAIYGTAHVLQPALGKDKAVDISLEEHQSGSVRAIVMESSSEDDNSSKHENSILENQPNSLDEESMIDEESIERTCADIFICPMCGKDFRLLRSFADHNERDHDNMIVQLGKFKY